MPLRPIQLLTIAGGFLGWPCLSRDHSGGFRHLRHRGARRRTHV